MNELIQILMSLHIQNWQTKSQYYRCFRRVGSEFQSKICHHICSFSIWVTSLTTISLNWAVNHSACVPPPLLNKKNAGPRSALFLPLSWFHKTSTFHYDPFFTTLCPDFFPLDLKTRLHSAYSNFTSLHLALASLLGSPPPLQAVTIEAKVLKRVFPPSYPSHMEDIIIVFFSPGHLWTTESLSLGYYTCIHGVGHVARHELRSLSPLRRDLPDKCPSHRWRNPSPTPNHSKLDLKPRLKPRRPLTLLEGLGGERRIVSLGVACWLIMVAWCGIQRWMFSMRFFLETWVEFWND